MKLSAYLASEGTTPTAFARQLGVAPSTITRMLKGDRGCGLLLAQRIEEATKGRVVTRDLVASSRASDERAPGGDAGHPSNSIGVSSDDCLGAGVGVQGLSVGGK
jgi:hypothetical protein